MGEIQDTIYSICKKIRKLIEDDENNNLEPISTMINSLANLINSTKEQTIINNYISSSND